MTGDQDERLAAWLDGALDGDALAAFEAELRADPALAAKAARWQANDRFVAAAYAPLADAPLDPAMLAALGLAETPAVPPAANDNPPWWRRHRGPVVGGALAAGLAAALILVGRPADPAADPVSVALDTTPSLGETRLADGRTVRPRLTVRAADGRWCREYTLSGKAAVACRGPRGWQDVGRGAAPAADPSPDGETVLAGGSSDPALDRAYAALGASDPLDQRAEAQAMASGWAR